MKFDRFVKFALGLLFLSVAGFSANANVKTGLEVFLEHETALVRHKKVALVTNPAGIDSRLQSSIDLLFARPNIDLVALFGPEHGIRGTEYAGDKIGNSIDPGTGLPVYSLYGKNRKPSADVLKDIDVIIIDLQDIGVRAYTYMYTMAKVLEAAAENNKTVIVLDRPNPLGGERVEGNLVEDGYFSFVGMYPIPYLHGMTIGELALLFNSEFGINCDLYVVHMEGWKRSMDWMATGLPWVMPSPHLPHPESVYFMAATGTFGELGSLSEGVGYTAPFEIVGAPWIDADKLCSELMALQLPGVAFRPLHFKPFYSKFKGEDCSGVQIYITDVRQIMPYSLGLHILATVQKLYPNHDLFANKSRVSMFEKVIGSGILVKKIRDGVSVNQLQKEWQPQLQTFMKTRKKYLIYN